LSGQPSDIDQLVRKTFEVKESFVLPDGEVEYQVAYGEGTKQKFALLKPQLASAGYRPELTGSREECVLTLRRPREVAKRLPRLPVLLALFALVSLVVFSLLQEIVYEQLVAGFPGYAVLFGFGGAIALMFGVHELAQRIASGRRDGGRSNSYLIPGIPFLPPFIPTYGFVSSQREPALNRDRLFDSIVVGPIAILILTTIVYAIGDLTAVQSTIVFQGSALANSTVSINPNAIQVAVDSVLGPFLPRIATGYIPVSPLADAATVGFVLVFIAFLPMATYDGGFLSALALGERTAKVVTYLSVFALLVLDTPTYWAIAIIVLLLAGRPYQIRLLDEVSGLSRSRKWFLAATIVIAFLCLPFPHNLGTLPLS
jgi:hypothetical protein